MKNWSNNLWIAWFVIAVIASAIGIYHFAEVGHIRSIIALSIANGMCVIALFWAIIERKG